MEYSNKEFNSYKDLLDNEKDWKSKLYSDYKNKIDAQRELAAFALNFIKDNEKKIFSHDSPFFELASFFAAKAIKTFRAIQCLIENGYGEDAAILIRCQFELLTNILYISKDDQDTKAERYIRYNYILQEKFLNKLAHSKLFYEVYDNLSEKKKKEIGGNYENNKKLYPKKIWWSGKSVEQMANDVGLKDYYISIYCPFSNLIHSNIESSKNYVLEDDINTRFIINISDNLINQIIVANCDFILRIINQLNGIFQLGQDDCLQEALNRFCEAFPKELSKDHV